MTYTVEKSYSYKADAQLAAPIHQIVTDIIQPCNKFRDNCFTDGWLINRSLPAHYTHSKEVLRSALYDHHSCVSGARSQLQFKQRVSETLPLTPVLAAQSCTSRRAPNSTVQRWHVYKRRRRPHLPAPMLNYTKTAPVMQAQLPALRRVRENLSMTECDVYPLGAPPARRRSVRGASRVFTVVSARRDVNVYEVPHAFGGCADVLRLIELAERVTPASSVDLEASSGS
eukprot:IDg13866t1